MTLSKQNFNYMNKFNSFKNDVYYKDEILNEYFKLEGELVELTIPNNVDHRESLRIYDVENYLETVNADRNYIASKELAIFKEGCKKICNRIKAEISGKKGENKAFAYLNRLNTQHLIIKNIELSDGETKTEIDAVVISQKKIFIIEVKNTSRDIFIDEDGNYYRTGKFLNWDSNILHKLDAKEKLLRNCLKNIYDKEISIERIVVFTNNRIKVTNACLNFRTAFITQLPFIIDRTIGCNIYTLSDIEKISQSIEENRCKEAYALDFDINDFKSSFIKLMTKLSMPGFESEEIIRVEKIHSPWLEKFIDYFSKLMNGFRHPNKLTGALNK